MVLPDSDGVSRAPPYSGVLPRPLAYAYGAVTRYGPAFQRVQLRLWLVMEALQPHAGRNRRGLG
jgi:hypothetical protein